MKVDFGGKTFYIKEYVQYIQIIHPRNCMCSCRSGIIILYKPYKVVGYVNTTHGYMAVFECQECFKLYRHHIGTANRYDLDGFKKEIGLRYHMQNI